MKSEHRIVEVRGNWKRGGAAGYAQHCKLLDRWVRSDSPGSPTGAQGHARKGTPGLPPPVYPGSGGLLVALTSFSTKEV
jgi:hypothetical protein